MYRSSPWPCRPSRLPDLCPELCSWGSSWQVARVPVQDRNTKQERISLDLMLESYLCDRRVSSPVCPARLWSMVGSGAPVLPHIPWPRPSNCLRVEPWMTSVAGGGGSPNQPIRPELEAGTSQNNTPEARPIWTLEHQSRGPLSPDDTASILPCIRSRVLSYHFDNSYIMATAARRAPVGVF